MANEREPGSCEGSEPVRQGAGASASKHIASSSQGRSVADCARDLVDRSVVKGSKSMA